MVAEDEDVVIIDTRNASEFTTGFIPGSINIGLDGQFAPWLGVLLPNVEQKILLVTDSNKVDETITRMARIGYDRVIGFLNEGFKTWMEAGKPIDKINRITVGTFVSEWKVNHDKVIDLRRNNEYQTEHLLGSHNAPLDFINEHLAEFPKDKHFYIHCAGGYRSMIAASILKSRGWHNFSEIEGGFDAIKKSGLPISEYVCPSTLK